MPCVETQARPGWSHWCDVLAVCVQWLFATAGWLCLDVSPVHVAWGKHFEECLDMCRQPETQNHEHGSDQPRINVDLWTGHTANQEINAQKCSLGPILCLVTMFAFRCHEQVYLLQVWVMHRYHWSRDLAVRHFAGEVDCEFRQSQVRFNRVPEKVPDKFPEKVPEKVWEALGAEPGRSTGFRRRSGRIWCRARPGSTGLRRRSGRIWCRARPGSTGFRRRSGRIWCRARPGSTGFRRRSGAEPGQVQQGSGEGLGGFGAEPGQVQQGSGEGSRKPWCKAKSGSQRILQRRLQRRSRKRFWESLVQGQVRFNRFNRINRVSSAWLRSTLEQDL